LSYLELKRIVVADREVAYYMDRHPTSTQNLDFDYFSTLKMYCSDNLQKNHLVYLGFPYNEPLLVKD